MTETEARRELRNLRLSKGWSYDELTADINKRLGGDRISMPTVRRFIQKTTIPHDTTKHDIVAYLEKVQAGAGAAA